MELELLLDLARSAVPDDGRLVHAAAQQQVALAVPLEREDGPLVVVQRVLELACAPAQQMQGPVLAKIILIIWFLLLLQLFSGISQTGAA